MTDGDVLQHQLGSWEGLEILVRPNTVDLDNLSWMADGPFWRAFTEAAVGPEDTVFDLGAHIGAFALRTTAHTGCRVLAVEPDRSSFRLYSANLFLNDLQAKHIALNAAIGGHDGTSTLYEHKMNWAHTTLQEGSDPAWLTGVTTEVPCWSLASCFDLARTETCAFMKMNVEGAEFDFVEQASLSDLRRIRTVVAELHFDRAGRSQDNLGDKLRSAGFDIKLDRRGEGRAYLVASRVR